MGWFPEITPILIKGMISTIIASCRIELSGGEIPAVLRTEAKPLIFVFWHCHIFFLVYHFRNSGAYPLISLSSDGELIARTATRFGLNPVRGSSSRGGARAFLDLKKLLQENSGPLLITADGPRGPAREVKPGTIQLAARTGAAVIPVSWRASRAWTAQRSWDQFMIPLPFAKIHCAYGEPLFFPPGTAPEKAKNDGLLLENALGKLEESLVV